MKDVRHKVYKLVGGPHDGGLASFPTRCLRFDYPGVGVYRRVKADGKIVMKFDAVAEVRK